MDTELAREYGAVELEEILAVLGRSERACCSLEKALDPNCAKKAVEMLKSGTLDGEVGNLIHDHFADEIMNESVCVWEGEFYDQNDPEDIDGIFPIGINKYENVYYIWALEYDEIGYFLSKEKAIMCAFCNWDNIRCTSE